MYNPAGAEMATVECDKDISAREFVYYYLYITEENKMKKIIITTVAIVALTVIVIGTLDLFVFAPENNPRREDDCVFVEATINFENE